MKQLCLWFSGRCPLPVFASDSRLRDFAEHPSLLRGCEHRGAEMIPGAAECRPHADGDNQTREHLCWPTDEHVHTCIHSHTHAHTHTHTQGTAETWQGGPSTQVLLSAITAHPQGSNRCNCRSVFLLFIFLSKSKDLL